MTIKWNKIEIEKVLHLSKSWSEALRNLGLTVSGNNVKSLKNHVIFYGLSVEHFLGKAWAKDNIEKNKGAFQPIPIQDVLVDNRYCDTMYLKIKS